MSRLETAVWYGLLPLYLALALLVTAAVLLTIGATDAVAAIRRRLP